ncbi:SDR family NAD(P)-dependent oxidoreductase [Bacillus rubiinfantis]|uniref:SDR family NAD(P)-dependent oxidoreductase n=1 Tax=Bacillus rubiinfantis TaxID=1499680 RepID=UPI0005A5FE84|nr:SDR family oxidoreductase [Bacillus rubiinfantis]
MDRRTLNGINIVITGASGGIGAEMAKLCAARGANLVLLARSLDKLKQLETELEAQYLVSIDVFQLDISNTMQIQTVFQQISTVMERIDILVNNAGFGIFRAAHEASISEIKEMFAVNVVGLMACTSMVLPQMQARRSGQIINIASQAGKIATPKSSVYSATKHAVLGYSNALRMELYDYNIGVTTVNPGPIATNFFEIADEQGTYVKNMQRFMLQPEYVARKIVDSMLTNKREINLPRWMNLGSVAFVLFPRMFERVGRRVLNKK